MSRYDLRDERGVTIVLFAVLLPLMLILTAIAWDAGNWWVHRKHLQTKVDAAAFAGGGAWSIPCGSDSDTNATGTGILDLARRYVGVHTEADGALYTATAFNPQVGGTNETKIHVVLNGSTWWDDDAGQNPADKSGQTDPNGSVCDSMVLDVKGTEANNSPLFGWIPLAPDIKRKARVEIQEIVGLRGLLPIAVRVPKPLSAAAIFYDEENRNVLDVRYFHEVCTPPDYLACISDTPTGLGQWTTTDLSVYDNLAQFNVPAKTGVVIATSFRPACSTGSPPAGVVTGPAPCMEDAGFAGASVDNFCRQVSAGIAPVRCEYSTGSGASQTVQSGLQFIRGYGATNVTNGPPDLESVWLDGASGCGSPARQAYFNSQTASCSAALHAEVDIGTADGRTTGHTDVKYGIVYGNTVRTGESCLDGGNRPNCDMAVVGTSWTANATFSPANARYAVAIRVRLNGTTVDNGPGPPTVCPNPPTFSAQCQWFFTAAVRTTNWPNNGATLDNVFNNPLQRSFMGNLDRSASVKWLRLSADTNCSAPPEWGVAPETAQAASVQTPGLGPGGANCFYMEMGLQGGLARDQDEPPIQLNIGATSQSSVLDCDPNISNLKSEIVTGCQDPAYAVNRFNTTPLCPGASQFFSSPKAAPFNPPGNYPPWRCVLTQTSNAANQVLQGLNERFFGDPNNPSCPQDPGADPDPTDTEFPWAKGRNYWHNANNDDDNYTFADDRNTATKADDLKNRLRNDDPRLVTLFFTPYDSFTGNGNETYPIVAFGNFYITGYGRLNGSGGWQGGAPEEPCNDGNGDPSPGAGSKLPPDLDMSGNGTMAWGHFVKAVVPNPFSTETNGVLCQPNQFQPCVAVLVE